MYEGYSLCLQSGFSTYTIYPFVVVVAVVVVVVVFFLLC